MSGFASRVSSQVSVQEAIEEIARVHCGGDQAEGEKDLLRFMANGDIYAHVHDGEYLRGLKTGSSISGGRVVEADHWRKHPASWRQHGDDIYLYRSHVQLAYRDTLWQETTSGDQSPPNTMQDGAASDRALTKAGTDQIYLSHVEEMKATKGRYPTDEEDEAWRKANDVSRPRMRELRGEYNPNPKGGAPKKNLAK